MVAYSLDQALQDIAALRQDIANLKQNLSIANSITGPDGTVWNASGITMNGSQIYGEDTTPVAVSGFAGGWGNRGGGFPVLSIQRLPIAPGLAVIIGEILSASSGVANPANAAGVGAAYFPATEQPLTVRMFSNVGAVTVAAGFLRGVLTTGGQIQIAGISSAAQVGFQIFGIVSLTL